MNGSLLLAFAPKGGGRDIRLSVSPREGGGGKKVETQVSPTKYACFALSGNLIPLLKADTESDWEFVFSRISFSRTNFQLSRRNNTPTTFDNNTSHILIYSVRANTQVTGQRKRVRGDTSTEDQSFLF